MEHERRGGSIYSAPMEHESTKPKLEPEPLMFCPLCHALRKSPREPECHGAWRPFPPAPMPGDAPWRVVCNRLTANPSWYRPLCEGYMVLCSTSWGKATMEIKDADNFSMWFVEKDSNEQ